MEPVLMERDRKRTIQVYRREMVLDVAKILERAAAEAVAGAVINKTPLGEVSRMVREQIANLSS
jgi:hypothetical protein